MRGSCDRTGTGVFFWLAAVALSLALGAPSAGAADLGTAGGITYLKKSAPIADAASGTGTASVKCPHGESTAGGGFWISGAGGGVSSASSSGRKWKTEAYHASAETGSKITAWHECAATRRTEHRSVTQSVSSSSVFNPIASCYDGLIAGGGFRTTGPALDWRIGVEQPEDGVDPGYEDDDGWFINAVHYTSSASALTVDAFCLTGPPPTINDRPAAASGSAVTDRVGCGRSGSISGGGVSFSPYLPDLLGSRPYDGSDRDSIPDDGWEIRFTRTSSTALDYTIYAICR